MLTLEEYAKIYPSEMISWDINLLRAQANKRCCMVPTTDNWYPTYDGGYVQVSLIPLSDGTWRCCVWGDDDFGLDFDTEDRQKATEMYELVTAMPNVVVAHLKRLGFVNA